MGVKRERERGKDEKGKRHQERSGGREGEKKQKVEGRRDRARVEKRGREGWRRRMSAPWKQT